MPSRPDIRLTERLAQVGGLMDIPLADHIIIGDGSTTVLKMRISYKERGIMRV